MSQFPLYAPLSPNPPWHMWGNAVNLRVDSTGLDPDRVQITSQQLDRIAYKRPDTWSFFFGARLKGSVALPSAATICVVYDIFTGIGRSVFQTGPQPSPVNPFDRPAFAKFVWTLNLGAVPGQAPVKYTTQVDTPRLDDRVPDGDLSVRLIDFIPAQDIQVTCQLIVLPILVPTPYVYEAEAHAYFAPRSHVRPDWLLDDSPPNVRFRGDELGGT